MWKHIFIHPPTESQTNKEMYQIYYPILIIWSQCGLTPFLLLLQAVLRDGRQSMEVNFTVSGLKTKQKLDYVMYY